MNSIYNQLFNPQYANEAYLRQLQWQRHDAEQRQEIRNIVKAIHDYFDAGRKLHLNTSKKRSMPVLRL